MEVETGLKRSGRRQPRHDTGRRLTEGTDGIASTAGTELNAVGWQAKSLESSRLVAPLDPRHELLHELLCLRQEELADISARRGRGHVEQTPSVGTAGIAHRTDVP